MMVRKHSFSFISPNGKVRSTPSLSPAFPKINSESLVPNFKSLELMLGYKGPFLHYKHIYIYKHHSKQRKRHEYRYVSPF